jgi:hypothetical protein
MKSIFWTGYNKQDRYLAVSEIEKIVNNYGYITDFKQFSDISMTIAIELEELRVDELYLALKSYMNLDDFDLLSSTSNSDCLIFLNITFTAGTGDLKIEVPAIPG